MANTAGSGTGFEALGSSAAAISHGESIDTVALDSKLNFQVRMVKISKIACGCYHSIALSE